MKAFETYCDSASYARVALVLLIAPIPCLVLIVLVDAIPLEDPALGLDYSALFWLRSAIVSFFVSFTVLEQCRHFVPKLRMTFTLVLSMTLGATAATTFTEIAMAYAIGYPVPFTIVASVPARLAVLGVWFNLKWGAAFRADPSIVKELVAYLWGLAAQTSLTVVYPLFAFVFVHLDATAQPAFSLVLPLIKLCTKNWISRAFSHLEDLKPEMVVLNVELFHALYLACCMQSSTSGYTLLLLVAIDYAQAGLALRDINTALRRIEAAHPSVRPALPIELADTPNQATTIQSALHLLNHDALLCRHPSVISTARLAVLESMQRQDQELQPSASAVIARVKLVAQQLRQSMGPTTPGPQIMLDVGVHTSGSRLDHLVHAMRKTSAKVSAQPQGRADAAAARDADAGAIVRANGLPVSDASTGAHDGNAAAVAVLAAAAPRAPVALEKPKYVQQVLQLLHLTEFVLLIEFTEVVIPIIYSVYIAASYNLPNQRFYAQFKATTAVDQVEASIDNVMLYAALELLSFVAVGYIVWRRIRCSALHQIAFVLETQWPLVQTKIIVWVLFTVQLPLYHFGADSTFRFKWLRAA